jgi:Cft2 family RNA processing exonuclease
MWCVWIHLTFRPCLSLTPFVYPQVITVDLHQTVQVDDELEIKAYYAGHVLGAAMFRIKVGDQSVVYTGDYNMTPDRHLGAFYCYSFACGHPCT